MKELFIMIAVLTFVIALVGCASAPDKSVDKLIYVNTPLQLPAKPTLPTLTGDDVKCLNPDVKQKVQDRDTIRRQYAEELEIIIRSTQK